MSTREQRSDMEWDVLTEMRKHDYLTNRDPKPTEPGWHPCSCGWEGYWCDWQPHVAACVVAALGGVR